MIGVVNEAKGLSFKDWIDVLIRIKDKEIIGNPLSDLTENSKKNEYQRHWIKFLMEYRECVPALWHDGQRIQKTELKDTVIPSWADRSIGNWRSPKAMIIVEGLDCVLRQPEWGHEYWEQIPSYIRLRPSMESTNALKFFYRLSLAPKDVYITIARKRWLDEPTANSFLCRELRHAYDNKWKIICLGGETYEYVINALGTSALELNTLKLRDWPQFYSTAHSFEWQWFVDDLRRMVNE